MQSQVGISHNWSNRKRRLIKFSVLLASIFVGLFVAEVGLRIVGYTYPLFYTTDPDRGYALRPNVEGWYRKEGEAYVRINSRGLRDREHSKEKPPDTLRIAVIGDSYVEAMQVPAEDAFWGVMERRLQDCEMSRGKKIEVISFGVSGYGTAQELITLRRDVWDYSPDIVLLAFTTNNDVADNSRLLDKTDEIPYFVHRDGQLVLDDSFKSSIAFRMRSSLLNRTGRWMRDNSRVIQALHQSHAVLKACVTRWRASKRKEEAAPNVVNAVDAVQAQRREAQLPQPPRPAISPHQVAANVEDIGIDNLIYQEPHDAVWEEAWRATEGLLALMHREVESRGAQLVVTTLSNAIQVHPNPESRQSFMRRVGATDMLYPDRRIKRLGEREGFTVINLALALQAYAERNNIFLHGAGDQIGNGHWNQLGHRVAGELLADKLCDERQD
ncbi:MAG: SGNH/GDSL hydrolase family protein [Pyrinomonadaceae bacterium]